MKKLFFITTIIFFIALALLIFLMSTIGLETNKFNEFISDKAIENNKDISIKLEKVKFKLNIKDFDLYLETKKP